MLARHVALTHRNRSWRRDCELCYSMMLCGVTARQRVMRSCISATPCCVTIHVLFSERAVWAFTTVLSRDYWIYADTIGRIQNHFKIPTVLTIAGRVDVRRLQLILSGRKLRSNTITVNYALYTIVSSMLSCTDYKLSHILGYLFKLVFISEKKLVIIPFTANASLIISLFHTSRLLETNKARSDW